MEIEFTPSLQMRIAVFLLVLIRISGLFMMAPFFGGPMIPPRIKVFLAAGVSICVAPLLSDQGEAALAAFQGPLATTLAVTTELAVGLAAGMLMAVVIAAVQTAGQMVAHDVGMTIANIIDPLSNQHISILGQLQATVAVVVFLAMDLHHHLVRLVTESFRVIPLTTFASRISGDAFQGHAIAATRDQGTLLFDTAARLALPVTVTLLLVTVALAFLARSVPEINVFILGFSIRIIVGFFIVIVMFPLLERVYQLLFDKVLKDSWNLLQAFSGA